MSKAIGFIKIQKPKLIRLKANRTFRAKSMYKQCNLTTLIASIKFHFK